MIRIEDLVIEESENFITLNKPSGILAIRDREGKDQSLKEMLQVKYGEIFTVHRLDRETSGIIVFARNEAMHRSLSLQFENRETTKIYNGLVLGVPSQKSGVINEPISEHPSKKGMMAVYKKGRQSVTEYDVVENFRLFTWMDFRILTGRTHQIRVHMKYIGHPVACDPLYGDGKPVFISQLKSRYKLSLKEETERPLLSRLALHASKLSFKGLNGELHSLEAPLPKDLKALLNQLRKWKK